MCDCKVLKVGDTVRWRPCFGMDPERPGVVTNISITSHVRDRGDHGVEVKEVNWLVVKANLAVVSIAPNWWAYGEQIDPLETR